LDSVVGQYNFIPTLFKTTYSRSRYKFIPTDDVSVQRLIPTLTVSAMRGLWYSERGRDLDEKEREKQMRTNGEEGDENEWTMTFLRFWLQILASWVHMLVAK